MFQIAIHVRRGDAGGRSLGDSEFLRCALHALRDEQDTCLRVKKKKRRRVHSGDDGGSGEDGDEGEGGGDDDNGGGNGCDGNDGDCGNDGGSGGYEWGCAVHIFSDAESPGELKNLTDGIERDTAGMMMKARGLFEEVGVPRRRSNMKWIKKAGATAAAAVEASAARRGLQNTTTSASTSTLPPQTPTPLHFDDIVGRQDFQNDEMEEMPQGLVPILHLNGDLKVAFHHMVRQNKMMIHTSSFFLLLVSLYFFLLLAR
jgi:hypothetical protein